MNKNTGIIISTLMCLLLSTPLFAEYVFFKDGSIIEGAIVSDAADSITFRTKEKQIKKINRSDIIRILYTELKMGKIYIQKRDGEGVVGYIVDEDRTSYTFRKDLYKPEEFTLNREDVLFMAEKNPSGLKGEAGTDSIKLSWHPPYDAVKKFNVYISQQKGAGYILAESTSGKSAAVKNLKSNTTYYVIVRSVDSEEYESNPSNELKITTGNIPPDEPEITGVQKDQSGDSIVSWNEAKDPDGQVKGYNVYIVLNGVMTKAASTDKLTFTFKAGTDYDSILVKAFDDRGDESGSAGVNSGFYRNTISIIPAYITPQGKLSELAEPGFGAYLTYSFNFSDFALSPETGFTFFPGKVNTAAGNSETDFMFMIPLSLKFDYRLRILDSFFLIPGISAGYMWIRTGYSGLDKSTEVPVKISKNIFDPVFRAGLMAGYTTSEKTRIFIGGDYGYIYETAGSMSFISILASVSYSF